MSDRMCASPLDRGTEFEVLDDPVTHTVVRRFGTCGPRASASALSSALGKDVTLQQVYSYMREQSLCDESGASTSSENLHACVTGFGAEVAEDAGFHDISTGGWTSWLEFFRAHAGIDPIHFETSDGQALVDSITGLGENATNLQYHFPSVLGYHVGGVSDHAAGRTLPEGFWVADGDNFAGGNSNSNGFRALNILQFYTVDVLSAAKLVAGFALKGRATMLDISQVAEWFSLQADGSWLCKPTGKILRGGDLAFYRSFLSPSGTLFGFSDMGLLLTDEVPVLKPKPGSLAQPTILVGERCAYAYDPDRVIDNPPGSVGPIYKVHLNHPVVLAVLQKTPVVTFGVPTVATATVPGKASFDITVPYTVE